MRMTKSGNGNGDRTVGGTGRAVNGALLAAAVLAIAGVVFLAARTFFGPGFGPGELAGAAAQAAADIGGPFTLTDQDGRTVTDKDFRGRWLLVYFGFTYCPDVCPTSLARNGDAIELLGAKGEKITPVLISVDPGRDTPEAMKDYVKFFHPRTVGLTGTREQVAAVAREYRVYSVKVEKKDSPTYVIDHSTFTYLIDPDGRFVQFFRHEASPQEMADKLNGLL
jgi:cytochrome oxidase Cu insertion factor (SCO1/SenC/PrrC family)